MFLPDDLSESERRYSDSYVGYTDEEGIKKPLRILTFTGGGSNTSAVGTDPIYGGEKSVDVQLIDWRTPKLGAINVDRGVVVVHKVPSRQWKRGLSSRNINIHLPLSNEITNLRFRNIRRRLDNKIVISQLFNPEYPTPEEALQEVKSLECVSRAFNNKFFFGVSSKHENIGVYYDTYRIGYVNQEDEVVLYDGAGHHFEELSQYIQCHKEGE